MAAKKKLRTSGERALQASRSSRNKAKRIARQYEGKGTKNPGHIRGKLRNRLKRLKRKVKDVKYANSSSHLNRITAIESTLKQS